MSILSWLKEVTTSGNKAGFIDSGSITFDKGEEQFQGLDMKAALDAHLAWTRRLEDSLNGTSNETLDAATVSSDCKCALGQWLYGVAREQFAGSSEYQELRQVHADFHLKAGEIVTNVLKGEEELAHENLRELRYKSNTVQLSLVRLYSYAQH